MRRCKIVLVDDRQEQLDSFETALRAVGFQGNIDTWKPQVGSSALDELEKRVDDSVALVATDYDLTGGVSGLFGTSIVSWCAARLIPVANFSRGNFLEAEQDKGLFDLHVSSVAHEGANRLAALAVGFESLALLLQGVLDEKADLPQSPANALALALDREELSSQFSPYFNRVGSANGSLVQALSRPGEYLEQGISKAKLLTYISGHVLVNGILSYPGPILSAEHLLAYCATDVVELPGVAELFEGVRYRGPFEELGPFFWRQGVDEILDSSPVVDTDSNVGETMDVYNRRQLEGIFSRAVARHTKCQQRCHGERGGFWCPFTHRPVCDRDDCSVVSTGWVPFAAELSRVEKSFYDEWAPIIGY